ncbi:ferredoxin [Rhodococcus sp. 1168]|uniref:ferredoxin n=1 Tax=Rhodococcus sp. 1168 TaxID=2018041 RepID=UPI000A0DF8A0|nr:ferredoxin [Rhodococcus sp. 1168]ORI13502.1 ferredoxin [Rhodococcus sp. 1168]
MRPEPTVRADRTTDNRLLIHWSRCDGRGLCTELLPEILTRDEWGYPMGNTPDLLVPVESLDNARKAVELCPRMALMLRPHRRST